MENLFNSLVEQYLPDLAPNWYFIDIEFYLSQDVRAEYYDMAVINLEDLLPKTNNQCSPLELVLLADSIYCVYEFLRLEKLEAHEKYRER